MKRWLSMLLAALLALALPCAQAEEATQGEAAAQPRRVAYLTFDDGPKEETPELLALLEELDVPATFFLVGLKVRNYPEYARMIVEAGHAVGYHSMGHSYSYLKESVYNVERDIERFTQTMREHADPAFTTDLFRFPGGSTSYSSRTRRHVRNLGYAWFDWNAMSNDTVPGYTKGPKVLEHLIKTIGDQEVVIVLMHEGKKQTRDALPEMVQTLRERGYEFRVLSTGAEDRAILENCPANMGWPDLPEQTEGER